jgi:hypothetical protein
LFAVLYWKMTGIGVVSPLVHPGFLSTSKDRSADADSKSHGSFWLVKISRTKAADNWSSESTRRDRIGSMPQNGAALWI